MNRRSAWAICWLAIGCATSVFGQSDLYGDLELEPEYEATLLANTYLMQAGGVDTLVLKDGTEVLIGVSLVAIKPDATPADMLKAQRVAELKSAATVGQFLQTDVSTVSELVKKTTVQHDGDQKGRIRRVEKFLSTHIEARAQLKARMKRVGSWRSGDGRYQFCATAVAPLE